MLSRRGSGRGNPSRPSAGSGSTGQVPTPLGTENIMRPSQFLNPSSLGSTSSPSFGSATFTFNCTLSRPQITAHVSVLFLEEFQDEGEPSTPLPHSPGPSTRMHYETSQPASAVNTIPIAHAQTDEQEIEEGGCRIVEESPE